MSAIRNITIGRTERLYKPVGYTMLANLVNIVLFAFLSRRFVLYSVLSTEAGNRLIPPGCGVYLAV